MATHGGNEIELQLVLNKPDTANLHKMKEVIQKGLSGIKVKLDFSGQFDGMGGIRGRPMLAGGWRGGGAYTIPQIPMYPYRAKWKTGLGRYDPQFWADQETKRSAIHGRTLTSAIMERRTRYAMDAEREMTHVKLRDRVLSRQHQKELAAMRHRHQGELTDTRQEYWRERHAAGLERARQGVFGKMVGGILSGNVIGTAMSAMSIDKISGAQKQIDAAFVQSSALRITKALGLPAPMARDPKTGRYTHQLPNAKVAGLLGAAVGSIHPIGKLTGAFAATAAAAAALPVLVTAGAYLKPVLGSYLSRMGAFGTSEFANYIGQTQNISQIAQAQAQLAGFRNLAKDRQKMIQQTAGGSLGVASFTKFVHFLLNHPGVTGISKGWKSPEDVAKLVSMLYTGGGPKVENAYMNWLNRQGAKKMFGGHHIPARWTAAGALAERAIGMNKIHESSIFAPHVVGSEYENLKQNWVMQQWWGNPQRLAEQMHMIPNTMLAMMTSGQGAQSQAGMYAGNQENAFKEFFKDAHLRHAEKAAVLRKEFLYMKTEMDNWLKSTFHMMEAEFNEPLKEAKGIISAPHAHIPNLSSDF